MTSYSEKFRQNYNNVTNRQEFERLTGIKASDNPAAYIGYINSIHLHIITDQIEVVGRKLNEVKGGLF